VGDYNDVFDIQKLDERQLGQIEYVLNSPAYGDCFEPYLRTIRNTLSQRLLDPSKARKEEHPDDFLRGGIVAIDGLLSFFSRIIAETQSDRIFRALAAATPDQQYTEDQKRGSHVPILGANESLEPTPYRADEDY
jgi:hypothetical protein